MPTLDEQFREFARKYPTPASHPNGPTANGDTTWDQDCAAFVYRFGMFVIGNQAWQDACEVFGPTAWDVARASGTLNADASKAPGGAIHWWRSSTLSGKPGHVGVDLIGGGTKLAMATYAADPELAPALGYASVAGYSAAKPAMKYVGWSLNYGGARFPITASAGGGATPIEEEVMAGYEYVGVKTADGKIIYGLSGPGLVPGGILTTTVVTTAEDWNIFTGQPIRWIPLAQWPRFTSMCKALHDLAVAQQAAPPATSGDDAAVLAAIAGVPAATRAALEPDFAAVPAAVVAEIAS